MEGEIEKGEDKADVKELVDAKETNKTSVHWEWLSRIGAEERGVEWCPPEERLDRSPWDSFTFWFSVNVAATTVPIGLLGPEFGLGLKDSLCTVIFFNILGCLLIALCAIQGPITGLRQMIIARYSFGFYGGVFLSFINIITQAGFAVVAILVGGQSLQA
ncbi:hypothetical protein HK100_002168, partial [Physocladia obscura]